MPVGCSPLAVKASVLLESRQEREPSRTACVNGEFQRGSAGNNTLKKSGLNFSVEQNRKNWRGQGG